MSSAAECLLAVGGWVILPEGGQCDGCSINAHAWSCLIKVSGLGVGAHARNPLYLGDGPRGSPVAMPSGRRSPGGGAKRTSAGQRPTPYGDGPLGAVAPCALPLSRCLCLSVFQVWSGGLSVSRKFCNILSNVIALSKGFVQVTTCPFWLSHVFPPGPRRGPRRGPEPFLTSLAGPILQ